jgi:hypothetical protein
MCVLPGKLARPSRTPKRRFMYRWQALVQHDNWQHSALRTIRAAYRSWDTVPFSFEKPIWTLLSGGFSEQLNLI